MSTPVPGQSECFKSKKSATSKDWTRHLSRGDTGTANHTREAREETLSTAHHQGDASQNQRGSASRRKDGGDQANRTAGAGERNGHCGPSVSCAEACGKQFCSFSKGKTWPRRAAQRFYLGLPAQKHRKPPKLTAAFLTLAHGWGLPSVRGGRRDKEDVVHLRRGGGGDDPAVMTKEVLHLPQCG